MSTFTFKWPKGPEEVILTGSFDNWAKTLYLVKQSDGSFELSVPLPTETEKVLYKYVVDGEWTVSKDQRVEADASGNENNYLEASDLVSVKASGTAIPEAGGLTTVTKGAVDEVKTTVMPQTEQVQATQGEAGIFVPKDAETLKAFGNVRDVDAKALNEEIAAEEAEKPLSAAEKKKQKKKVKRSQYKAKKKKKNGEEAAVVGAAGAGLAAGAAAVSSSDVPTGTEESAENTPEPEEKAVPVAAPVAAVAAEEPVTEAEPVKEAETVIAPVAVEEPAVEEPVTSEPVVSEPVAESTPIVDEKVAEEPVVPVVPVAAEEPVTEAPIAEAPVEENKAYHSLDPNVAETEATEVEATPVEAAAVGAPVAAAPVAATKAVDADEEEIIVAQGKGDIEAQILASENGNVTLEEIKPTESERVKLTEDAGLSEKSVKSAEKSVKSVEKPAAKETKKEVKKEEPKKKKGFFAKLKKIFD